MTNVYAKRKDVDAVQCNDGVNGALTMNSYGYLHVDQNKEIKNNLDDIKTQLTAIQNTLEDIADILNDVYDSTNHQIRVSGLL